MQTNSPTKNYRQTVEIPAPLIFIGKVLQFFSIQWAANYAAKLFYTPFKFKVPKRELPMDNGSIQKHYYVPAIQKEIIIYEYGTSDKKILLSHGWSGRGTQLVKIADKLLEMGYSTVSFDAPGHGKSQGKATHMLEFVAIIHELHKTHGPFMAAIGHSLGGMALLNAIHQGLPIPKLVTIGSGDVIDDIMDDFIERMKLRPEVGQAMSRIFEKRIGKPMNSFSSHLDC